MKRRRRAGAARIPHVLVLCALAVAAAFAGLVSSSSGPAPARSSSLATAGSVASHTATVSARAARTAVVSASRGIATVASSSTSLRGSDHDGAPPAVALALAVVVGCVAVGAANRPARGATWIRRAASPTDPRGPPAH